MTRLEEVLNANPQLSEEQREMLNTVNISAIMSREAMVELGWRLAMSYARAHLGVKTWKKKL